MVLSLAFSGAGGIGVMMKREMIEISWFIFEFSKLKRVVFMPA